MDLNKTVVEYLDLVLAKTYRIRSIFYLLTPSETYYESTSDVPDLTTDALNLFYALMLVEQVVFILRYGRFNGKTSDAITSFGSLIIISLPK